MILVGFLSTFSKSEVSSEMRGPEMHVEFKWWTNHGFIQSQNNVPFLFCIHFLIMPNIGVALLSATEYWTQWSHLQETQNLLSGEDPFKALNFACEFRIIFSLAHHFAFSGIKHHLSFHYTFYSLSPFCSKTLYSQPALLLDW